MVGFNDINGDGFVDITVKNIGGFNDAYEFYLWNNEIKQFKHINFKNFDIIGYYEMHDSRIKT